MPFRRGRSSLRPVNRVKHVIDVEGTLVEVGTQSLVPIGVSVQSYSAVFNPVEIPVGHTVNGFFLSIFIIGATGAQIGGSINWYIIKTRSGQAVVPEADSVGTSDIRNQVFHQEKGLAGSGDGTPMAFKGVIAVPKGMRRMREGDQFFIALKLNPAATSDADFCVRAIYNTYG